MPLRNITATTARWGAFVLVAAASPVLAASPSTAAPETAISTTGQTFVRNCQQRVDGITLRVQLTITFSSSTSNDVKKVTVRATDNGESGTYRNLGANIHSNRIKVVGPSGKVNLDRTSSRSPFSVFLDPTSTRSGRDAISVSGKVSWTIDGHRTVPVTCFYIDA